MKSYAIDKIRNVAVIGHGSTGKTTLVEALLYHSGVIKEKGAVDKGDTQSDSDPEEVKRKISVHLTPLVTEYRDMKINLLDTPGVPDFCLDVNAALRVSETAIFLVDGETGLQIETERNWIKSEGYGNLRCIMINKMDKEKADFNTQLEDISHRLEATLAPILVPIGAGKSFKGVVNILTKKAVYVGDKPDKPKIEDAPADVQDQIDALKEKLIEAACEGDDALMEKFLEGQDIADEEILNGIRAALSEKAVVPVLCGAPLAGEGVNAILDFIVDYLPDPTITKEIKGTDPSKPDAPETSLKAIPDAPVSSLIFKTVIDQYIGKLSYFRVFSGTIKVNDTLYNPRTRSTERITKLFYAYGKKQMETESIGAGDLGAVAKLEKVKTGDTLCSNDAHIQLEELEFPSPISFTSIRAESKSDEEKLNEAMQREMEQDPAYRVQFDPETKETVIRYMGEIQHEMHMSRVKDKLSNIEIVTDVPRIAYRETIRKPSDALYRHKKQSGGHGQFGEVHIQLQPQTRGEGFEFVNAIVGGVVPKQYIPGVEKGLHDAMEEGVLASYPVQDIKVTLDDGKYHSVDSSEMSFRIAAKQALKEAMKKADPVLLEPIMKVRIFVQESQTGSILNDLNGKRAQILGMDKVKGSIQKVEAFVPLAEMIRYSIDLKSLTSGAGTFEMEFDHYNELTGRLADKVVEERTKKEEEE
jgi:elongation factor G